MKDRFAPSIVGLMFVPFGYLLGVIAMEGIVGMFLSILFAYIAGDITTRLVRLVFIAGTKKTDINQHRINSILLKNALYMTPLLMIAIGARFLLGWVTIMPFVATASITYVSAASVEMDSIGMNGRLFSILPSMITSGITMVWTIVFSFLF